MNAFLTSDVFMVEQKSFSVGSQYTVFDENGAARAHESDFCHDVSP